MSEINKKAGSIFKFDIKKDKYKVESLEKKRLWKGRRTMLDLFRKFFK